MGAKTRLNTQQSSKMHPKENTSVAKNREQVGKCQRISRELVEK